MKLNKHLAKQIEQMAASQTNGTPNQKAARQRTKAKDTQNGQTSRGAPYGGNALLEALCRQHGLSIPQEEYPFAKEIGRKWRFDYLWEGEVALEIEGGMFGRGKPCPTCNRRSVGAHTSIKKLLDDIEKYNTAAILGYTVIRCTPEQWESGQAFQLVKQALGLLCIHGKEFEACHICRQTAGADFGEGDDE